MLDIQCYDLAAKQILTINRGIGMTPPFHAETASVKGDESWPFWIVRNKTCNSTGGFYLREDAEAIALMMNRLAISSKDETVRQPLRRRCCSVS